MLKIIYRASKSVNCTRGFTLVELLIVLALLGIVLAGLYNLLFFAQSGFTRASASTRINQDARLAIVSISNDLRNARPYAEGEDAVTVTNSNQIDITIFDVDANSYRVIRYRLENGELERGVANFNDGNYEDGDFVYAPNPIVSNVQNNEIFSVEKVTTRTPPRLNVRVDLRIDDPLSRYSHPLEFNIVVAVRSQEVRDYD